MNSSGSVKIFELNKLLVKSPIKVASLLIGSCTLSLLFGCDLVSGKAPTLCEKGGMHLEIEIVADKGGKPVTTETITKIQKILSTRLTNMGLRDAPVIATGSRFSVDLPGAKDATEAEKILGNTAQLTFRAQQPGTEETFNLARQQNTLAKDLLAGLEKAANKKPAAIRAAKEQLNKSTKAIFALFSKPIITGEDVQDARAESLEQSGGWSIMMNFNEAGAQKFTELTKSLAGTGQSIGIFLDDQLISAPTVDDRFKASGITGGRAEVNGNFAARDAESLAIILRSGNLPHKIEVIVAKSIKPGDRCKK
jgi:preprotein translocase subunit SecD